jgi:membrane-associated phospholipid phosphatase
MDHQLSQPRNGSALALRQAGLVSLLLVIGFVLLTTSLHDAALHPYARFASRTGNVLFIAAGLALIIANEVKHSDRRAVLTVLLAALALTLFVHALKLTIGHWLPRPSGHPGGFPSGHATGAFAIAYLLSRRLPKFTVLWYIIAIVIAWSRVETHSHYLYQVIAGTILGIEAGILMDTRYLPSAQAPRVAVETA